MADPAPELMRLRIISVAALNCGTYLGGESIIGASVEVATADVLEFEAEGASIVKRAGGIEVSERYAPVALGAFERAKLNR